MNPLGRFLDILRQFAGLLLPFFAQPDDLPNLRRQLRAAIHVGLLAVVLAVLFVVSRRLAGTVLEPLPEKLRVFWLPLCFLAFYVVSWGGYFVLRMVRPVASGPAFPDIDTAWDEAMQGLKQGGLSLTDAPLFLIIGRPAAPEEGLFRAAQLGLEVGQSPRRLDAPLHVYANREGIYLTIPGACLLGKQAMAVNGQGDYGGGGIEEAVGGVDPTATLKPTKGAAKKVAEIFAEAQQTGRGPMQLTEAEREEIRLFGNLPEQTWLKNKAEVDELTARLRHVCRLIARGRRPYCPINGILLLVPFAASESEALANETAAVCSRDLAAVRETLQVQSPLITVVCDLETAPGFGGFIERFGRDELQRRVGQRFPLAPDLEHEQIAGMIESGVQWLCNVVIPTYAYKFFRVEAAGENSAAAACGNAPVYRLMSTMRLRWKRLARIVARLLPNDPKQPPLYGGCYVAGTGVDPKQQAFVPGVFRRLIENENCVSWTAGAASQDLLRTFWTTMGYMATAAAAAAVVAVGFFAWRRE